MPIIIQNNKIQRRVQMFELFQSNRFFVKMFSRDIYDQHNRLSEIPINEMIILAKKFGFQ